MKRLPAFLTFVILGICLLTSSCNLANLNAKVDKTANAFYTALQKNNYDSALLFCSSKSFEKDSKASWKSAFEKNSILLGNIKAFSKTNQLNIAASTASGTTVTMVYDVQWQYGKSTDSLVFIKENDGSMKVYNYEWQHEETTYMAQLAASEKQADQYMDFLQSGNYDAAIELCAAKALTITPKEKWVAFFNNANQQVGTVSGHHVLKDRCSFNIGASGDAGIGNYYNVVVESDRGGNSVKEKIVFFQKDYDQPVQLAGHFFL